MDALDRLKTLGDTLGEAARFVKQDPGQEIMFRGTIVEARAGLIQTANELLSLLPTVLRSVDPDYPPLPKREPLIQRMVGEYRVGHGGKKRFIASALVATNGIKDVATHGLDVVGISILGAADNDPTVLLDITREEAVKFARRLGLACGFEVTETTGGGE